MGPQEKNCALPTQPTVGDANQADAALIAMPAEASRVLDEIPAVLTKWDLDQCCVFANKAAVTWFGRTRRREVIGKRAVDLLGPEVYRATLPFVLEAIEANAREFDRTLRDRAGRTRHLRAYVTPTLTDGDVCGVQVLVVDLTSQRDAQRVHLDHAMRRAGAQVRAQIVAKQNDVITRRLFGATLELSAALTRLAGDTSERVRTAIEEIDSAIGELRSSLAEPNEAGLKEGIVGGTHVDPPSML